MAESWAWLNKQPESLNMVFPGRKTRRPQWKLKTPNASRMENSVASSATFSERALQDIPGQEAKTSFPSGKDRISKGLSLLVDQEVICRECVRWTLEKDLTQPRSNYRVRIKFKCHPCLQCTNLPGAQRPAPSWGLSDFICKLINSFCFTGCGQIDETTCFHSASRTRATEGVSTCDNAVMYLKYKETSHKATVC